MTVLPDILAPDLTVVFCGTVAGQRSAERGHYYAGPGNAFWQLIHQSGLTPRRLSPEEDGTLPTYGLGLTDLVKNLAQSHDRGLAFDVVSLVTKVEEYRPRWLAFTSKTAGQAAARSLGYSPPGLGPTPWLIAGARVFVLPSPSAANRRRDYDGRATRSEWWADLARLAVGARPPRTTHGNSPGRADPPKPQRKPAQADLRGAVGHIQHPARPVPGRWSGGPAPLR